MGTTSRGIPYPDTSDVVDDIRGDMQALAEGADAALGAESRRTKSGVQAVALSGSPGAGYVDIAFTTPFASIPRVVAGIQTGPPSGGYVYCWAANITASGFRLSVMRSNTTTTTCHWVATDLQNS